MVNVAKITSPDATFLIFITNLSLYLKISRPELRGEGQGAIHLPNSPSLQTVMQVSFAFPL